MQLREFHKRSKLIIFHLVIMLLILTPFSLDNALMLSLLGDLKGLGGGVGGGGYNGYFLLSPKVAIVERFNRI